jgi:hypothetical protein
LQEMEMHNGTVPYTENLGDKSGDVQYPDMQGSLDRESGSGLAHFLSQTPGTCQPALSTTLGPDLPSRLWASHASRLPQCIMDLSLLDTF